MWQEARKQEKIIRGMMVDHRRRAERRKGYYEKIKKDPAQFLQVWGRKAKIHIDPSVASAADNPSIMTKWRGDEDVVIDRFDARSHLDYLAEFKESNEEILNESEKNEERMLNFERYRNLIQNEALGITETQCLKQIEIEEKFGDQSEKNEKKSKDPKAQIGYAYQDSSHVEPPPTVPIKPTSLAYSNKPNFHQAKLGLNGESDEEEEKDLDLVLDITKLTSDEKVILNKKATDYGMEFGDYVRMLIVDNEEKEALKRSKEIELEKSQYSGRKSRRERRIAKEARLRERGSLSPLSFIVPETKEKKEESDQSDSRSSSSSSCRKKRKGSESPRACFITSFGQDVDEEANSELNSISKEIDLPKTSKIDETKANLKRLKQIISRSMSRSRSRSKSVEKVEFKKKSQIIIKQKSSSSSSDSSSDEEKALEKYLKRKQIRSDGQTREKFSSKNYDLEKSKSASKVNSRITGFQINSRET
ncbi:unnamed protein product [Brachionus calyciflorus]|uniref:Suppressor of white apricot N-terminal domain-containing protein n=1 Tax=Brachionus calyciflorus TaxID=104777 RepID=A0A814BV63_9BILA|nr:unnamed protein product [Brachionus calyciflorus]